MCLNESSRYLKVFCLLELETSDIININIVERCENWHLLSPYNSAGVPLSLINSDYSCHTEI